MYSCCLRACWVGEDKDEDDDRTTMMMMVVKVGGCWWLLVGGIIIIIIIMILIMDGSGFDFNFQLKSILARARRVGCFSRRRDLKSILMPSMSCPSEGALKSILSHSCCFPTVFLIRC